jgi:hypothetical protein
MVLVSKIYITKFIQVLHEVEIKLTCCVDEESTTTNLQFGEMKCRKAAAFQDQQYDVIHTSPLTERKIRQIADCKIRDIKELLKYILSKVGSATLHYSKKQVQRMS